MSRLSSCVCGKCVSFRSEITPQDLFSAITADDRGKVRAILDSHPKWMHTPNSEGQTPIHLVAQLNNIDLLVVLFQSGCHIFDARTPTGQTPLDLSTDESMKQCLERGINLQLALRSGDVSTIEAILTPHPIWMDRRCIDGITPLQFAISAQNIPIVELILDLDLDGIDFLTPERQTLFHLIAKTNNPKMMNLILLRNSDWKDRPDAKGLTPIQLAVDHGHIKIVKLLLQWGCRINSTLAHTVIKKQDFSTRQNKLQMLEVLLQYHPELLSAIDEIGWTIFHLAAVESDEPIMAWLLQLNPTPATIPEPNGTLPLHIASRRGNLGMVEMLLQKNSSVIDSATSKGNTAFHLAVKLKSIPMVELLLRFKSQAIDLPNDKGQTPLHLAVKDQDMTMVDFLLHAGSHAINCIDGDGTTPLHLAVQSQNTAMIEFLLRFICQISDESRIFLYWTLERTYRSLVDFMFTHQIISHSRFLPSMLKEINRDGWTPLHFAAFCGHSSIVDILIIKDWERLNLPDFLGRTPLHLAVKCQHMPIVYRLLRISIPPLKNQITPLHIAVFDNNLPMVKLLVSMNSQWIDAPDARGYTPLNYALNRGWRDVARILRAIGATMKSNGRISVPNWVQSNFRGMHPGAAVLTLTLLEIDVSMTSEFVSSVRAEIYFDSSLFSTLLNLI